MDDFYVYCCPDCEARLMAETVLVPGEPRYDRQQERLLQSMEAGYLIKREPEPGPVSVHAIDCPRRGD